MAPPQMAAVLAIALFASGLMDVAVGHFLRARTRSVRAAAAVQLLGAAGAGLAFFLFLGIEVLFGGRHVLLALAIGLAFRLAYAFYDVPQNAVLGLASGGERLRAGLSSLRFVCSGLASLSIAAVASLLLAQGRQAESFAMLGAAVGVLAIGTSALFLWSARVRSAASPSLAPPATPVIGRSRICARTGRHLALLLGVGFAISVSGAVFMKLEPYFAAYLLDTTLARGALMAAVACGGIASQPFAFWCVARRDVRTAFRLCAAILMLGALAFLSMGTHSAAWAAAAGFATGFGLNGLGMLLWTAVANAAAAPGAALAPTVTFGLLTLSQKCASAMGTLAIGAMLGWDGVAPASAASYFPIVLAMGLGPFAGALVCAVLAPRLQPSRNKADTAPRRGSRREVEPAVPAEPLG